MAKMEVVAGGTTMKEGLYVFQLLDKITPRTPNEPPFQRKRILAPKVLSYDPETGRSRVIRFIPGVQSIWMDDQEKVEKNYADANEWRPEFNNGTLTLQYPQDAEKIACLMARDEYDGKEGRISKEPPVYTLVNKEQEYGSEVEYVANRHKAEGIALQADDEAMLTHASFLGVNTRDGDRDRSLTEIRADYIRKASSDPKLFLKSVDSPMARFTGMVNQALKSGAIDLGHVRNQAHYAETKALIMVLDPKRETAEQLAEFAFSDKGADFKKRLAALVKKT